MRKFLEMGAELEERLQKPACRMFLLAAAIGCMVFGCMRGELSVVLGKAVTVCLECIGLG